MKNDLINSIGNLNQEEIDLYKKDIQKRVVGNTFIGDIYFNKALLPTSFRDIKIDEAIDWHMIAGRVFLEIGLSSGEVAISMMGVPWYLLWGISSLSGTFENIDKLDTDSQMLMLSVETLFDGFTESDIISRNTYQALRNIEHRTSPQIPDGKIVSIENFGRGFLGNRVHYNKYYSFLYKDIFSQIDVKNTGNIKARFELTTQYYKKFSTGLLTKYQLPVVVVDSQEIEAGQTKTFYIAYKEDGEGIDPKNQDIFFSLLAQTNNGIYGIDRATTSFGTTKIVLNNVNISEEELNNAMMYPYPIRSEIENDNNYTLNIYIENPFEFFVQANLTQEIPLNIDIISAGSGTIVDENIFWELELEAEERKEITITFTSPEEPGTMIKVTGAMLKIYDQVNDNWLEFLSNDVSFKTEWAPIFNRGVKLTLKDCNDNDVTFKLTGPGYGEIDCQDPDFSNITLFDTTEKSSFTISTKGNIQTSVGDIVVNGSLKKIMAKTTDLRGDLTLNGSLGSVTFDDIADDHTITIGPSTNPRAGVTMKFDQVSDLTINSEMPIKTLSATEWLGGSLNAPSVGTITIAGDKKRGISGDLFKVDIILSQEPDAKILALGKLTVKDWIDSSRIISTGHIGTVTAGAIADSSCFAGVTNMNDSTGDGVLDLPDPAVDINYAEPAMIKSITVKGIKGEAYCVINSSIAAALILSASLAYPENENGGIPFGLSAGLIKALKIKDVQGTESWKNLDKPSDFKEFSDLKVLLY